MPTAPVNIVPILVAALLTPGLGAGPGRAARPRGRCPRPRGLLGGGVRAPAVGGQGPPPGEYARRADPAPGRGVVVPGGYRRVPPRPVSAFQALVAIPRGMS